MNELGRLENWLAKHIHIITGLLWLISILYRCFKSHLNRIWWSGMQFNKEFPSTTIYPIKSIAVHISIANWFVLLQSSAGFPDNFDQMSAQKKHAHAHINWNKWHAKLISTDLCETISRRHVSSVVANWIRCKTSVWKHFKWEPLNPFEQGFVTKITVFVAHSNLDENQCTLVSHTRLRWFVSNWY